MIRLIFAAIAIALASPAAAQGLGILNFSPISGKEFDVPSITQSAPTIGENGWIQMNPALQFAQAATPAPAAPTDQEIADAKSLCNRPENFEPKTKPGSGPPPGPYKAEYKARCEAIDAEHERRGIAAATKKAKDLNNLDSIIGRLSK